MKRHISASMTIGFWATVSALTGVAAAQSALLQSRMATGLPTGSSIADIVDAEAKRFGLPAQWVHDVIRVESAGQPRAVSRVGAIGLMQVMPATYAELRRRYALGDDPFDVRDNIRAGTSYLRELYDRYGQRGMLAAYNAGPRRWKDHLAGIRPLPIETRRYLERLAQIRPALPTSVDGDVAAKHFWAPDRPPALFIGRVRQISPDATANDQSTTDRGSDDRLFIIRAAKSESRSADASERRAESRTERLGAPVTPLFGQPSMLMSRPDFRQ